MLNPDEVFQKLERRIRAVSETETVPVASAINRVTAADVAAPMNLPPFVASAMDGYAVRAEDGARGAPYTLDVVGESLAGHPTAMTLDRGQAIRVFTGAMMPEGADAVVLQEDTTRRGDVVEVQESPSAGRWVRPIGHDVKAGTTLIPQGTLCNAFDLSWLAACGIGSVLVNRRVRVGLFSTGDELVEVGTPLGPGQIYDSNRFAITTLLARHPVELTDLGNLPDDPAVIERTLAKAAADCDMIVTSGGVSVGDADYVRPVVEALGEIDFWKIALKPGKPLAVGRVGDADFFGLPGNPVSTIVTLLLFVVPAVELRAGAHPRAPRRLSAVLAQDIEHDPGRREYQRGVLAQRAGELVARATGDQSSNRLSTFRDADCLIVVPEDRGHLHSGDRVDVILLPKDRGGLL